MLGTALLLQIAELGGWFGLHHAAQRQRTKDTITFGRPQPTKIPIVDSWTKRLAGHPSKTTRAVSERIVGICRKAVNTRSFENIIAGLASQSSPIRKKLHKKRRIVHVAL